MRVSALEASNVIEDYRHAGAKFAARVIMRLSCFGLATAGIIATLHIAFGG